ncbi:hypothetical protein BDN72DRAFT_774533, partial [Pluteus cervinus]
MALHKSNVSPNSPILNLRRDELQELLERAITRAAQLEPQLTPLTAEYDDLIKACTFYRAALAPWKQLPNETLQRVFYFTKSAEPPTCIPFSRTEAPMQLTQVCSRWRAVALATPELWQDLKWVYISPEKYAQQEVVAFMQSWLSRAAYAPLSI